MHENISSREGLTGDEEVKTPLQAPKCLMEETVVLMFSGCWMLLSRVHYNKVNASVRDAGRNEIQVKAVVQCMVSSKES